MGMFYTCGQVSTALSATVESVSLKAVNRTFVIREYVMAGTATASAANVVILQENTVGTITTAIPPYNALNTLTSTSKFSVANTPTSFVASTIKHRFGLNGNGALFRWVAAPGLGVEVGGTTQIGWHGETGTSTATTHCIIEET